MPNHHHIKRTKKRTTTIAAVDRISNLPCPILHHILSFLPPTDVIRTCVLSKTFFSVFTSFPVIDLDSDLIDSSEPKKRVEFVDYVDCSVQRLKIDTDLQKFRLRAPTSDSYRAHRILDHIDFAIKNRVQELDVDLGSPRCSLPRTIASANFIKTLNLAGMRLVNLSELNFNSWWPKLESLSIRNCNGFKVFNFSSGKIRSIFLKSCKGLNSVKVESSSLESFTFLGSSKPCEIDVDVSECKFIKALSMGDATVKDHWVEDNVPKFLHLEVLKLDKLSPKSRHMKVSSKNLKTLEVMKSRGRTEIQSPNLESLRYSGVRYDSVNIQDCFPLKILSMETIKIPDKFLKEQISNIGDLKSLELEFTQRCTLKRFEIIHRNSYKLVPPLDEMVQVRLKFPSIDPVKTVSHRLPKGFMGSEDVLDVMLSIDFACPIDNIDFVTFWKWIAAFGHVKVLTIACNSVKDMANSETEWLDLLTPISDLKHLTIKQLTWTSISPDLVNCFLCQSPNLETLHFASAEGIERSMEFVYRNRTGRADKLSSPCCRCLSIECWRHSVEKVVLKNFRGVERDELKEYFREKFDAVKIRFLNC